MSNASSEEINLLELFARLFITIKKNILLVIGLPIVCAALLISYSLLSSSKRSVMLISTTLLTENECKYLFKELSKDSRLPTLSQADQQKVLGLSMTVDSETESDNFNRKKQYITVTAEVTDTSALPMVEKAVVDWLNGTASAQRNRKQYEKYYTDMIKKIDAEIAGLDDVKKAVNPQAQANYLNPSDLYANSVLLFKDRTTYEILLEDTKSVNVARGFTTYTKSKMSPVIAGSIGIVIGIILAFIGIFLKFVNAHIEKLERA